MGRQGWSRLESPLLGYSSEEDGMGGRYEPFFSNSFARGKRRISKDSRSGKSKIRVIKRLTHILLEALGLSTHRNARLSFLAPSSSLHFCSRKKLASICLLVRHHPCPYSKYHPWTITR